jgi:hypothetical protein
VWLRGEGEGVQLPPRSRAERERERESVQLPDVGWLGEHEQITAKLEETRRYYDVFNTLQETKKLLQKEISLLNSIESQFEAAMSNYDGKSKFVYSVKVSEEKGWVSVGFGV